MNGTDTISSRLGNRSIRAKLIGLMSLLLAGIAAFIQLYFPSSLEEQATEALKAKAESIASMIAFSVSPGMLFNDRDDVLEILSGAMRNKDLVYVAAVDTSGKVFAVLKRDNAFEIDFSGSRSNGESADAIYTTKTPVVHNQQEIGQILLGLSMDDLREQVSESRGVIALVSAFVFALGLLAAILISTAVSRPLVDMVQTVRKIEHGDLGQRARVQSGDEIGELAKAFNLMVDKVEGRTAELHAEISDRKRAEGALRESESTNRVLLDAIPDLMFRFDREGTYLAYEGSEEELYVPADELLGRKLSQITPPEVAREALKAIDNVLTTGRLETFEYQLPIAGEVHHYECRMVVSGEDEVLAMIRDVSDYRRAEQAQRTAEDQLESQKALSMRSDRLRSLGEMAAGMAHELNQPLVGVRGLAEHILIGMERGWELTDEVLRDRVTRIVEQADRMVHIIQHVRLFAREAGKVEESPVQVNEVVRSSLDMLEAQLRSLGVDLECDLVRGLPKVLANPFSLEEVVLNLLSNARDALNIDNDVEEKQITLSTHLDNGAPVPKVHIVVEDSGPGIPEEALKKVFDPFFTTKDPDKGTGLGLSVSKAIVEGFDGELQIRSGSGGTTATIILPAMR